MLSKLTHVTTPQNPAYDASAHATASLGDYRRVWDASPLAFVVVDGSGVVTAVSPAGARLFAARSDVLTRQRFLDLVEPMDRGAADDMLRRASQGEVPPRQEIRFVRPSGEGIVGGLSIARLAESASNERLAVIRDLSHEHTLRPNLLQTEKLATMGAVAATVAHEVNNPLMGASGALQTLRLLLTSPEKRELVDTALAEIERAARIVQDLRQFAHRGDDEKQKLSLTDLLQSTAKLHLATHGHEVPVTVQCEPDMPGIEGVRNHLVQALRNLLRNAHQAMAATEPARRSITLRARRRGADAVAIDVADRGPGVPSQLRDRIFDAFFSTKSATEGTGLGLTVVQAVAGSHGGRVDVSDTDGGGATFTIVLPACKESPKAAAAPAAVDAPSLPDGLRLLLVDDEPAIRFSVARYLCRVNPSIHVTEAADASEAIAALRVGAFDVALLDRHFPGGGHAAVLEAMTGLQPHLVPGTILMSGALEEDANERIGLGYGAALNKPFDLRALTQTITRLAQRG